VRRRALLAGAAALPAALAAPARAEEPEGDPALISRLHRSEMFGLAVYRIAVRVASPRVHALAAPMRNHEFKHVAALATTLEALGAVRTPEPTTGAALAAEARRLGVDPVWPQHPDRAGALPYLHALETALLRAWIEAHPRLRDPDLLRLAGEVLACQAQHLVVLRDALGTDLLPTSVEAVR
jgi:hypothetical protein